MSDISYNVLYSIVKNKRDYMDALIMKKHKRIRNENIANYYHYALEMNGKRLIYRDIEIIENSVLVVGSDMDNVTALKELVEKLVNANWKVIFKPHPRDENTMKYLDLGCILFKNASVSLETVLERLVVKPKCIIGNISSTLFTGKMLFDIKTISCSIFINNDEYGEKASKLFFDAFKDIIIFPRSINQLLSMLGHNGFYTDKEMQ